MDRFAALISRDAEGAPPHQRSPVSHAGQPHPGTHGRGSASYSHAWKDKTEENANNLIGNIRCLSASLERSDFPVGPYLNSQSSVVADSAAAVPRWAGPVTLGAGGRLQGTGVVQVRVCVGEVRPSPSLQGPVPTIHHQPHQHTLCVCPHSFKFYNHGEGPYY